MPLRPGRCYRHFSGPPYTRKEYIVGVPPPKITVFEMGDKKGSFNVVLKLVAKERGQIRHNALEAARIASNRIMEEAVGKNYHLKIMIYPHHVLRENKMMAFAGADRLQDGMRLSFGKPIGTAARIEEGQELIVIRTSENYVEYAKKALKVAASKIPISTRIIEEKITEQINMK
ncbi:MAG: 50S ribosomal protein L16 [Candidatus Methanomethylicia archaeon]|nr:50S ribosomal protein L16 [Candidatus Methanomethylicia archaeon]MCX8169112.1 50S ribosomal protein L16 [Candidatus Methanomethylicia archaeon]MDW7988844.1 50S ribosomal protein L16 [Nitrososphaerota archaeon]